MRFSKANDKVATYWFQVDILREYVADRRVQLYYPEAAQAEVMFSMANVEAGLAIQHRWLVTSRMHHWHCHHMHVQQLT